MEGSFLIICSVFVVLSFKLFFNKRKQHKNLPPSPQALPFLGHLHILKQPIHRTFRTLSQKYGPVFSLRLGSKSAIVVSSPSVVEECFNKNDVVLASRPFLIMGKYLGYGHTTIATAPYGDHWRNLRRISALEVFSTNRLNKFAKIRREEIEKFLTKLYNICPDNTCFSEVKEVRAIFSELTFGIIMRMVTGKIYTGGDLEGDVTARRFREAITEIFLYAEASYPGDFLPILEWIDYKGYSKKVKELAKRSDEVMQDLIDEQRSENFSGNSMISHLLSLQKSEPLYYTDAIIKGLVLDIILAGTESSALTIEWAMSNLLNNPHVLHKAKAEIDKEIGQEKLLEESDVSKLPYLQNIISETFRLYPAGPLLLPHLSQNECTLGGFNVPKNTIVFVNAWAMQRDPQLWEDATTFKPERFQENQLGENFNYKYMPFGLGRRACPGMGLANRVIGFAVGSMIQCFEWKRIDDKEIDMSEGVGLTMPKAYPLEALCKPRDIMKTLSNINKGD